MPIFLVPLLSGLAVGGGVGFLSGSWFSDGWLKWLFILILVVFGFSQAKKLGLIK